MATLYTCQFNNAFGSTATLNATVNHGEAGWLSGNDITRILGEITGRQQISSVNLQPSTTFVLSNLVTRVAGSGDVGDDILLYAHLSRSYTAPITDYYFSSYEFLYTYMQNGIPIRGRLTLTGQMRTINDIRNGLIAAGANASLLPAAPNNPRSITCVDTTTNVPSTINLVTTPDTVNVTIFDGDPPYLANVSTTEPATRGVGDIWFNPSNGQLSVYTE